MQWTALFVATFIAASTAHQTPSGGGELEKARQEFAATVRKAQADYDAVVQAAAEKLRPRLETALERATKARQLDAAKALMTEIEGLGAGALPVFGAGGGDAVPGTWLVKYHPNGVRRTYVVKPSGDVSCTEGTSTFTGKIKKDGAGLLLDFNDGKLERLTFAGNRVFVEHYDPKGSFPQLAQVAIGESAAGR